MTSFISALVEAWQELRVHRLRVALSLFGVAVAICSLTLAIAATNMAQSDFARQMEQQDGRPAMLHLDTYPTDGGQLPETTRTTAYQSAFAQHNISFATRVTTSWTTWSAGGVSRLEANLYAIDAPFLDMHAFRVTAGRWFDPADSQNLSPVIVLDNRSLDHIGITADQLPTTVTLHGESEVQAVLIGTIDSRAWSDGSNMYMLHEDFEEWFPQESREMAPTWRAWVPSELAWELEASLATMLTRMLPGTETSVYRADYEAWSDEDPMMFIRLASSAVGALILLLGSLSLINVNLVTLQQRIREIGIRRSFGATSSRVFFSVMMESVVGTFVAGVIGVGFAIAIARNPWVLQLLSVDPADAPAFPVSSAILGVAVAVLTGAVAGLVPAVVAVRAKVIDAIRF